MPDVDRGSELTPWWKVCAVCGDRVGIYETVVIERPEGTTRASYLNLSGEVRDGPWRFLHSECTMPDDLPG